MSLSAETLSAVLRGAGEESGAWTGFLEPGLLLSPLSSGQPGVLAAGWSPERFTLLKEDGTG